MSVTLTIDGDRWRGHLREVAEAHPGIVPVAKGNGYGFGLANLARRAQWLADQRLEHSSVDTIAVGTYEEVPQVAERFSGSILVLTPWRPFGAALEVDPRWQRRVVHTLSRYVDVLDLLDRDPRARFALEHLTSMQRHGMSGRELATAAAAIADAEAAGARPGLAGMALHLPLGTGSHVSEVERIINDAVAAELRTRTVWVSHLTADEQRRLRSRYADFEFRPRVGTELWLGDREALRVTATVLDVHQINRGEAFGYRGWSAPRDGHLLIVSGGTAHGIGLEAPTGDSSIRARAGALARGGLDAVGLVRSPFSIDGKQRLFAEPPHMQASMLFLPSGARVPLVGDRIDVRVRFTATSFDRVEIV